MTAENHANNRAGRVKLLSRLSSGDSNRHQHQQQLQQHQQHRLDLPRPLTAKRRLSGADQVAAVPVGVEKPTIASTLRSTVGGNNFLNSGLANGCGGSGLLGVAGPRRRSQRIAPLLPFRLRNQQNASSNSGGMANGENGGGGSVGQRFNRLGSNGRPLSGAARGGGGGAGKATNLCYYSGGAGAFGRNGVGIGAPYLPKSAVQGRRNGSGGSGSNAGSRRASNSSGVGLNFNGSGGGGSTPGSRRSSQASIRSQGSGTGGGGRKKTAAAPVPTMLIDVQIQLPQSRHWPKWQRERIANSLFGNRPGDEQWITLDELDEKMRQLLLLRPQSAGKEAMQTVNEDVSDEDSKASQSRLRQRNQFRRTSLRSRSPSPNGSNSSGGYQQQQTAQQMQASQQQLLLRIKAKKPATERLERPLTRRKSSVLQLGVAATGSTTDAATTTKQQQHHSHQHQQTAIATASQLTSGIGRRKSSHTGLMFPHRWPSARATSNNSTTGTTTTPPVNATTTTPKLEQRAPSRQDLNTQAVVNIETRDQPKSNATSSESVPKGEDETSAAQQQQQQQQHPSRRFHKVGFGRAKSGRLIKTVSEQRFSFLGAAAGGGRRGSTVTAIAAAAAAGNKGSTASNGSVGNDDSTATKSTNTATNGGSLKSKATPANNEGGGRICGDDPYTSQLRNRVHNAYYNPGPVDAAASAAGSTTTVTALKVPNITASAAQSTSVASGKNRVPSLTHSISTPSIVIDTAGTEEPASNGASDSMTDAVGIVGQSTLAAASALRGHKSPVQNLLQVPGSY